jgi:hypothetical protein
MTGVHRNDNYKGHKTMDRIQISPRALALAESARALIFSCYGFDLLSVTLMRDGVLSHTALGEVPDPRHDGIARLAGQCAVQYFCASATSAPWQQATNIAIERLAGGDRRIVDEWRHVAEPLVLFHGQSITRIANALLAHGKLRGEQLLQLAAQREVVPDTRQSESEDFAIVFELQRLQALAIRSYCQARGVAAQ